MVQEIEHRLDGLVADHVNARCCAIMKNGKRCRGRWDCAVPCMFGFDATSGDGVFGPEVVLCSRHSHYVLSDGRPSTRSGKRFRIFRGWLGGANKYHYSTAVFARRTPGDFTPAKWWRDRRRSLKFGETRRDAPR